MTEKMTMTLDVETFRMFTTFVKKILKKNKKKSHFGISCFIYINILN